MAGPIGGLVLAAGEAPWGGPLALAPWGARSLVEHLTAAAASVTAEPYVVLGCDGEAVLADIDLGDATVVLDPEWREGPAAALRVGLDALSQLTVAEAVLMLDCRRPLRRPELARRLAEAHVASGARATVAKYRYAWDWPLVVARDLWPPLMGMEGDADAIRLLRTHPEWVEEVWLDEVPPPALSTLDDLGSVAPRR